MAFTLSHIAEFVGGRLDGPPELAIHGAAGLAEAGAGELSFLAQGRYRSQLQQTGASAVLLSEDEEYERAAIRVVDPYRAFQKALGLFAPRREELFPPGVHPSASVAEGARLEEGVSIGAQAVIEDACEIGARSVVAAGSVLMRGTRLGCDCLIYPNVTLREGSQLGDRVIVHSGAVLGSDGFGYIRDPAGYVKVPQIGIVVIEDDAEIGANVTIDRATTGRTVVASGCKIDNLVQIAHNVSVGRNTVISAQSGISGSTRIGSDVVFGGQVGVAGHINIGDRVQVAAKSGIPGNVEPGSLIAGIPSRDVRQWRRMVAHQNRLAQYASELADLTRRIDELERARRAEAAENSQD